MGKLPFRITREAEVHIEQILLDAQRNIELLAMARVVSYGTSCSWTNPEGGGGWYPFAHVVLGWQPCEEVLDNTEYTEFELVGFHVFVTRQTLNAFVAN